MTGAAQGIGKATSELVIKLGGAVVALDLNGDVLKASVKSLPAERVMMVTGSVVDADLAARTVEEAVKQFGAVHGSASQDTRGQAGQRDEWILPPCCLPIANSSPRCQPPSISDRSSRCAGTPSARSGEWCLPLRVS